MHNIATVHMIPALMDTFTSWNSLCIIVIAGVYLYFKHKFNYWRSRGIKGPNPIPWFGTTLYPVYKPKAELELEFHRKYGKLYGLYDGFLGTNPTLVCGHPEVIKQVTVKHFDCFTNRRKPATWRSIRYRALTYMRDEEWKNMRKIMAPTFTSNKLKKMYDLMKRCTMNMQNSIISQGNQEIDLKKLFSVFTVDIISTCCFSLDLKDYRDPESEILKSARKFFEVSRFKMTFYQAIPKRLLAMSSFDINDVSSIEFFGKFATEIINKRRQLVGKTAPSGSPASSLKKQDDFLQTLLDAAAEFNERKQKINLTSSSEEQQDSNADNNNKQVTTGGQKPESNWSNLSEQQLGDLEILAQTMLFFAVGHETTATLLSSCGYFLALNPELQERLYQEVSEAFSLDGGDVTYDRLLELKYLDAFVLEALRYFTPTLTFDREASEDVEIEVDGRTIVIPKGMGVIIPFHAVHHDPDNYENPERFDPERFMPENRHKINPCTFIPFGSGPRYCLASRFALMEAKLALSRLVRRFKFVRSEGTVWPPKFRHHYMLLQMEWPKIRFVDRKLADLGDSLATNHAQMAA